jgi:hypothetical protein
MLFPRMRRWKPGIPVPRLRYPQIIRCCNNALYRPAADAARVEYSAIQPACSLIHVL